MTGTGSDLCWYHLYLEVKKGADYKGKLVFLHLIPKVRGDGSGFYGSNVWRKRSIVQNVSVGAPSLTQASRSSMRPPG